jgi:hypothetical protein
VDEDPDQDDSRATTLTQHGDQQAWITLTRLWDIEPIDYHLKRTAFHEVMELCFAKYDALCRERCVSLREIDEERHSLIRIMENAIFENSK